MKITLWTLQRIFISALCLWMFLLVKNATDLHFGIGLDDDVLSRTLSGDNSNDDDFLDYWMSTWISHSDDGEDYLRLHTADKSSQRRQKQQLGEGQDQSPYSSSSNSLLTDVYLHDARKRKQHQFYDPMRGKQFHGTLTSLGQMRSRRGDNNDVDDTNATTSIEDHPSHHWSNNNNNNTSNEFDVVLRPRHFHHVSSHHDKDDHLDHHHRHDHHTFHRRRHDNNVMMNGDRNGTIDDSDNENTFLTRELDLPKPIIVMGFPKAGTSSIFAFFHRQGLRSQHWYCCGAQKGPQMGGPSLMAGCMLKNLRHNVSHIMDGCGRDIEVFAEINGPRRKKIHPFTGQTGWLLDDGTIDFISPKQRIFFPQRFRIDEIHQSYPNATWILNWRDVDDWTNSVLKWGDNLQWQFAYEYYMQGEIDQIPSNRTEMVSFLRHIYMDQFDRVRDFVKNHPTHALVEVNITSPNAGRILADAFGLSPIAWTNVNKNRKGMFGYVWRRRIRWWHSGLTHWFVFTSGAGLYLCRKRRKVRRRKRERERRSVDRLTSNEN